MKPSLTTLAELVNRQLELSHTCANALAESNPDLSKGLLHEAMVWQQMKFLLSDESFFESIYTTIFNGKKPETTA